ncbi:MAG: DUF4129 domain-containing protein [Candidatus Methanoperedens sp.]|nr:DUF4129 domain-containing protein [Candidatus Methanoperedens sp.]
MKNLKILIFFLIIHITIIPTLGEIPSHIDPANVTSSKSNLQAQQLWLINELLSYRSGVYISLNKGDIEGALDNLDSYQKILRENNNILIIIEDNVYTELNKSANILNLTTDQINQLLPMYEEGRFAYQNNQINKAIQIALKSRTIVGNLSSLEQDIIMEAVAKYPGVNTTLYQIGSSSFNSTLKEIQKRWQVVELTLFDETQTSLSISPKRGKFGDNIYIKGSVILPRDHSGVPNASMEIRIQDEVIKTTADREGKFNIVYKIPFMGSGDYPVQADFIPITEPLIASSDSSSFFIERTNTTITINVTPSYGEFGQMIHVKGLLSAKNLSGVSDSDIFIGVDNDNRLIHTRTDKNGSYEYDFTIPAIKSGEHIINVKFIPSGQPLFGSFNKTPITLIPSETSILLSEQNIAYVQDYLNISGQLLTDKNLAIPDARISLLIDKKEIGKSKVNNGKFFFSYWINENTSSGNHTVTVKFDGYMLFLPSENSKSVEIKNKSVLSRNIILLALGVGLIILLYLRKDKIFRICNDFIWKDRTRIDTRISETPLTDQGTFKESEIIYEEPVVKDMDIVSKVYAHLENLISQKQFKESISYTFQMAKVHISTTFDIKSTPQQTHWEFYENVRISRYVVADDLEKLTQLYETAMYSNVNINGGHAEKAVNLLKNIYTNKNEKNQ